MRISEISATDLFTGTIGRPLQIIRVTVAAEPADPAGGRTDRITVSVRGPGVTTVAPGAIDGMGADGQAVAEVGIEVAAPAVPGAERQVTAIAECGQVTARAAGAVRVAEPGWTMWMVSHFHYDPVWWNTQGSYAQSWLVLPDANGKLPSVRNAMELVRLHLDRARRDPDYKFVLAEIDYLKPFFDSQPQERADLLALIAAGRIEIVGGSYNEANTNLTCAESTIRNAVSGLAFQRGMLGARPSAAWMLDAFGFDPAYPGLMAAAGLAESSWARGPYHQWGPGRNPGGNTQMQFPSEFEWLSPDGAGLLTSYMPNHYGAGWVTQQAAELAGAERLAHEQFQQLAAVAATPNVLLPVGADHVVPSSWVTEIHRDWNQRYVWPRFVTAVPGEYFAAVREHGRTADGWLMPQTRDMNPVYTGKDVSYIDTKQAQRAAEIAVTGGERLATLAWLAGAGYPAAGLDKAWRLLAFGAHHDAITGTESDQVYLDLLAGWREAYDRGDEACRDAAGYLAGLADTAAAARAATAAGSGDPDRRAGTARPVVVLNTLSRPRSGLARITIRFSDPGPAGIGVSDDTGRAVGYLAESVTRHPDGTLSGVTLTFRASDVPALGWRTYLVTDDPAAPPELAAWRRIAGFRIASDRFAVTCDPDRGGTLSGAADLATGIELLAGPGNELLLQEEYRAHPRWGEGPWLLSPSGPARGSAGAPARVQAQRCPIGSRLVAEFELSGLAVTQETAAWDGADRIEFRTHVDGSIGQDRLLRVIFPTSVTGGLPVYQTGLSVIGRTPGPLAVDVAEHAYTLDCPAQEWFGVGSTARVRFPGTGQPPACQAIGVAEVIAAAPPPADPFAPRDAGAGGPARAAVRELMLALARQGVTATCTVPAGPRYGDLEVDSNLPDLRIAVGGPDLNAFTAQVLAAAGPAAAAAVTAQLAATGQARVWLPAGRDRAAAFGPRGDLRSPDALPVLIVAGHDLAAAVAALAADLADAVVDLPADGLPAGTGGEPPLAGHSVAVLNRGLPGGLVTPDGVACLSLMRACSTWPCGVWTDGERRTVPDGTSFAWQHWSHTFEYALAAGAGDWRDAGLAAAGQDYNEPLLAIETSIHAGPLPAVTGLAAVEPGGADLMALKPYGNPLAPGGEPDRSAGVTARLRDRGGADGPVRATLRLFTGIIAAHETGILEQPGGASLDCQDGAAMVAVPERGTVTIRARTGDWPAGPRPARSGPPLVSPEPVQPVYTRYWLHGKGPAPAGNLPVAVHLDPGEMAIPEPGAAGSAAGTGRLRLTVACGPDPASGEVSLVIPDGLEVTARRSGGGSGGSGGADLRYELAPMAFAEWELTIRARPGPAPGRRFLTARITDAAGQVLEDAAVVLTGEPANPVGHDLAELPSDPVALAELAAGLEAAIRAEADEARLELITGDLELAPGESGIVRLLLGNGTAAALHGEVQLISPYGSWQCLPRWTAGFAADSGSAAGIEFEVTAPPDARPGSRWWALAKVMYFGRLRYGQPFWITIAEKPAGPRETV